MSESFRELLPHRDPFLFLDAVDLDESGTSITAHWTPPSDWPIFGGHFPGNPVVPGVILVEVMAQAACILGRRMAPATAGKPVYLVGVDHARFRRQVQPGDRVDVRVRFHKRRRELWSFHGRATVDGAMAADAELLATVQGGGDAAITGGAPATRPMGKIDPTAIVDPTVEVDPSAEVGPFAVLKGNVKIGPGCTIGPHAYIEGNTTLGANNHVYPYAVLGSPPQDKKFQGEDVYLTIGDDNTFREFTTVNPGTAAGGHHTSIGDRNLLMAYVHVAHDCRIGNDCVLSNGAQLAGHVELEDGITIGGMAGVHQFVRVGTGAMTGGGSMVTLDVPPYCIAVGNRAMLHGLNLVGLKRNEASSETISALKDAYRILFRQGKLLKDALEEVEAELVPADEAVARMVRFIRDSERGVARPEKDR